jgi:N-methylhydantoinase A
LRFDRQGSELTVPVDETDGGRLQVDGLEARFKAEYARRFGEGAIAMGVPVELMTLRALGSATDEEIAETIDAPTDAHDTRTTVASRTRPVQLDRHAAATPVPVYDRDGIGAGTVLTGPALVDTGDTTVWLQRGYRARSDTRGALILEADVPVQGAPR